MRRRTRPRAIRFLTRGRPQINGACGHLQVGSRRGRTAFCVTAKWHGRLPTWVTSGHPSGVQSMSALPPKADIAGHNCHVRFVPKADIVQCSKCSHSNPKSKLRAASWTSAGPCLFQSKNGWISGAYFAAAIAICARSCMISACLPTLVHRHPTYSPPRRLAKPIHGLQSRRNPRRQSCMHLREQSPPGTSCPPICRTRSGTSMTTNSTNCYLRASPSRSDGARSSLLKSPSRGASEWSLPPL